METHKMPHRPKIISRSPVELGFYRHYKGGIYNVLHLASHSETQELLVVYAADNNPSKIWVRPHSMFIENVNVNGNEVPRFKKIDDGSIRKFG